jgi:hypothetical protein
MDVILREPLSPEIPLPPILQPSPIASNGHIGTRGGRTLYMGEAAAAKLSEGQR